jgi:hypothetical protein
MGGTNSNTGCIEDAEGRRTIPFPTIEPDPINHELMEKYLEPLNGRRFKERKYWNNKMIDMNILVLNLPDEDRKKILEKEGDEYDATDVYSPSLNGVKIKISDIIFNGIPAGYDNMQFNKWKSSLNKNK